MSQVQRGLSIPASMCQIWMFPLLVAKTSNNFDAPLRANLYTRETVMYKPMGQYPRRYVHLCRVSTAVVGGGNTSRN